MEQTIQKEVKVESRNLMYEFSNEEIQEMGREISDKVIQHTRLELEKKEQVSIWNKELKAQMSEIKKLSKLIDDRQEEQSIECEIEYNQPIYGRKTITRRDNYKSWDEPMDDHEFDLFNQQNGSNILSDVEDIECEEVKELPEGATVVEETPADEEESSENETNFDDDENDMPWLTEEE